MNFLYIFCVFSHMFPWKKNPILIWPNTGKSNNLNYTWLHLVLTILLWGSLRMVQIWTGVQYSKKSLRLTELDSSPLSHNWLLDPTVSRHTYSQIKIYFVSILDLKCFIMLFNILSPSSRPYLILFTVLIKKVILTKRWHSVHLLPGMVLICVCQMNYISMKSST